MALLLIALSAVLPAGPAPAGPAADGGLEVRGVNFAHLHRRGHGYGAEPARRELAAVAAIGGNWVALTDFAYMPDIHRPELRFGGDRTLGRDDLTRQVADAQAAGLKVMLKPHIWSRAFWGGDVWHGDVAMTTDADWRAFFDAYTAYLVQTAELAQETRADAVCVGVELQGTSGREDDWRAVIAAVRAVYDGPITYCAAFEEYDDIAWWDATDVAGISAYFKLADVESADAATLRAGWERVYAGLDAFHARTGKPVAFLELGYTAGATAAMEPWAHKADDPDAEYQARLYRVALEEAGKRDYLVGVFLWKWFTSADFARIEGHDPYIIQDRPAVLDAVEKAWQ